MFAKRCDDRAPHACHDAHVGDDVGAVGDLDADLGDGRADGAHREGDDVHGAPGHAAVEEAGERFAHLGGRCPVVGGACFVFVDRADEGAVFDAAHVGRVRADEIGVRPLFGVEADVGAQSTIIWQSRSYSSCDPFIQATLAGLQSAVICSTQAASFALLVVRLTG